MRLVVLTTITLLSLSTFANASPDCADCTPYPTHKASSHHRHFKHRAVLNRKAVRQTQAAASDSFLISIARQYIGTNPTGRRSVWCGAFMDMVLKKGGFKGGGNLALAYSHYGTRVSAQVGAIAVMRRSGGGHVGIVSGFDNKGNPIIISGNHNHTTGEATYPKSRIVAYVMPIS